MKKPYPCFNKVFKHTITGDNMFSDAYLHILTHDGAIWEVKTKYVMNDSNQLVSDLIVEFKLREIFFENDEQLMLSVKKQ